MVAVTQKPNTNESNGKMQHYIIVKWKDAVKDKSEKANDVRTLYVPATDIPGINKVTIKENVTARDNRYDLMIVIDMDAAALKAWDNSQLHHRWKDEYGQLIDKKAIFDADDDE